MLLAHLPSDKFLDKFLEIIKGILEFLYFPQHTICRAPQWRSCLLSVVASVFSSANRARSFQLLSSSPKQHKPHRVLRRIALCIVFCIAVHWWSSVEAAASARTNNWNGLGVWEDRGRDGALITTKSNQPTPPSFAKLGLLKIQLFPPGPNTPLVRTLGVQSQALILSKGGNGHVRDQISEEIQI